MKNNFLFGFMAVIPILFVYIFVWPGNSAVMALQLATPSATEDAFDSTDMAPEPAERTPNPTETIQGPAIMDQMKPAELIFKIGAEFIDANDDGVEGGVGDRLRLKVFYENIGETTANNIVIVYSYPASLISIMENVSEICDNLITEKIIRCEIGSLEPSDSGELTNDVILRNKYPNNPVNLEFTFNMTSTGISQKDSLSIPINLPNLIISKSYKLIKDLNDNKTIDPGDTVQFVIEYENIGLVDATNVKIIDDYDEKLIRSIDNITAEGKKDGQVITWDLRQVPARKNNSENKASVSYDATILDSFGFGLTEITNQATISSAETEDNSAIASIKVIIPTPIPSLTPTPIPTSVPVPDIGPQSGIFTSQWPPIIFIGVLSLSAMMVLFVTTIITQFTNKSNPNVCSEGMSMLRTGIFLIFIISAILIMALGRGIENNGAISILSAIVGYVFGRAVNDN